MIDIEITWSPTVQMTKENISEAVVEALTALQELEYEVRMDILEMYKEIIGYEEFDEDAESLNRLVKLCRDGC